MTATSRDSPRRADPRRTLKQAGVLVGLALVPRLILALVFLRTPIGLDDMHQYDMLGRSLASGHGYRWYGRQDVQLLRPLLEGVYNLDLPQDIPEQGFQTAFRPPGYPLFLALVYRLAGISGRLPAVRLVQAILGTLTPLMLFLIGQRLGLRSRASFIAGMLVALYPFFWFLPAGLATENLFIPLWLLSLLLLLDHSKSGRPGLAVLTGLVLGAATLTRGVMAAFVPIAAWWLFRTAARPRWALLAFSAAYFLVTAPWAVRNTIVLGRPAFVDGSLSYNLFLGYHPGGDGGFDMKQAVIPLQFLDDSQRDRWTKEQALGFIAQDPLQVPARFVHRWGYFWGFEDRELIYFYSNGFFGPLPEPALILAYTLLVLPFPIVLLSAVVGVTRVPEHRPWMLSAMAALSLPYLLIMATARFHLPLVPLLAVYAASAWTRSEGASRTSRSAVALAAAFAATVIMAWGIDLASTWPTLQQVVGPGGHRLGLDY